MLQPDGPLGPYVDLTLTFISEQLMYRIQEVRIHGHTGGSPQIAINSPMLQQVHRI